MGNLFEISMMDRHRVCIEKNRDTRERDFYSAHVQFSIEDQMVLDDRILPRLKKRVKQALSARHRQSKI